MAILTIALAGIIVLTLDLWAKQIGVSKKEYTIWILSLIYISTCCIYQIYGFYYDILRH